VESGRKHPRGCGKLTRTNESASELELPGAEKRLPIETLTLLEVEKLLQVPNVADRLGLPDRAMLQLFYSTGVPRIELCRVGNIRLQC
jgi:integrase/recombinase XerD